MNVNRWRDNNINVKLGVVGPCPPEEAHSVANLLAEGNGQLSSSRLPPLLSRLLGEVDSELGGVVVGAVAEDW